MDYDSEIRQLAGETLAIQRLLVAYLSHIAVDANGRRIVGAAFDEAAGFLEGQTIKFGKAVPSEHLAHSLRVVEDLRTATLGNPEKPKHAV